MEKFKVKKTIVRPREVDYDTKTVINECTEEEAKFYLSAYVEVCNADPEMKIHSVEPMKVVATCGNNKYLYEVERIK